VGALADTEVTLVTQEGFEPSLPTVKAQFRVVAPTDSTVSFGDHPRLVLVDARLDEPERWIAAAREQGATVVALVLTNPTGAMVSVADRSGADAVLVQPLDTVAMGRLISVFAASGVAPVPAPSARLPETVVGESPAMTEVFRLAALAAPTDSSVVIHGETGTGKEVVARMLHRFSPRRDKPFVAVNCAALSETLLESELFGHERGSFTGAANRRKGRFELADGGTLFLDEVGDLPPSVQVSLLRVLQEHSFERVGGTESVGVDVRVIAATHRDLSEEVRRGRFRPDLFYRLQVLTLHVPPLRERRSDVLALWAHFLEAGAEEAGRPVPETSAPVERLLLRHDWPGNVREVSNAVQHVLTMSSAVRILPADLPPPLHADHPETEVGQLAGLTLHEVERLAILQTYEALRTVKATARALAISERKIHYRLKEYREELATYEVTQDGAETERSGGVRVLLAEDDDELRWALSDFLRSEGYDVIAVRDGRAVLERLGATMLLEGRDFPADIIVSDLRMPGLTGMQILENVRAQGWRTPVILMSAFGDEEVRKRATELGAKAFLPKPVDVALFQTLLRDIADSTE
jgi:DNA-binding NtrC family response regulator